MPKKAKKRKSGEGSWGKKTVNGHIYTYFRDTNGKYFYGKTDREVKEKIAKATEKKGKSLDQSDITLLDTGVTNKTTFGEYVTCWLETKRTSVEPSTFNT